MQGDSTEEKKVVINAEDIKNIEDFFNHFRIPVPQFLQEQLEEYKTNPSGYTFEKQKKLKSELAHAIAESNHDLFKDNLFNNVMGLCNKEWYESQFERDFEKAMTPQGSSGFGGAGGAGGSDD